ncbi:MAG: AAA family ATPase [Lachnospiraceae bacterium]|nr:AAA family ATPase [Lachnospiraceae bacterium]
MDNKNIHVVQRYVPWYAGEYRISSRASGCSSSNYLDLTPVEIRDELVKVVIDQDEACRKVAMMVYQHLHGHRFVGMLAGPTGSGKSFIADRLKEMFPELVYIRDVSNVTCDGWSGGKKVSSIFADVNVPAPNSGRLQPIIFLDECDKMFTPKINTAHENVSESVQAEFLTVIHGGETLVPNPDAYSDRKLATINTSGISFMFAGAFEKTANGIAEKESGPMMGFGASLSGARSYDRELTMEDIHQAGCINELCGRIQRLVNLNPFSEEAYRRILDNHQKGPVHELEEEFGMPIIISSERCDELAHRAYSSGLGIRGIKNALRENIDDMLWSDCRIRSFEIA